MLIGVTETDKLKLFPTERNELVTILGVDSCSTGEGMAHFIKDLSHPGYFTLNEILMKRLISGFDDVLTTNTVGLMGPFRHAVLATDFSGNRC